MSSSQTVDGHDLVQWALWLPDGEAIVDGDDRLPSEAELREMASHLLADEGEQARVDTTGPVEGSGGVRSACCDGAGADG